VERALERVKVTPFVTLDTFSFERRKVVHDEPIAP